MRWTIENKPTVTETTPREVPEREVEVLVESKQYQEEHAWHIHEMETLRKEHL